MTQEKPRIAIVDDDASVCRALKRLIRSLDMEAAVFTSGEEYLQSAGGETAFRADCLILDLQMPRMSGLELQASLTGTSLPIIFITAHDDADARARALAAGAVGFLCKPFDDQLLARTLTDALSLG